MPADELARTKALLRLAQQHAHTADAERAEIEAKLLEAQARAKRAKAQAARADAESVAHRQAVEDVRRLSQFTLDVSSRVHALQQAQDTLTVIDAALAGEKPSPGDGAWFTVWLESKWRWVTSRMTTEQREHAADAVARYSAHLAEVDNDPDRGEPEDLRWWEH